MLPCEIVVEVGCRELKGTVSLTTEEKMVTRDFTFQ
jgi:hypothetical protein